MTSNFSGGREIALTVALQRRYSLVLCRPIAPHSKSWTSTPVVRTGVDAHMPIAVTANSLQHWPSPSKLFITRSTTVGQICRTGLTTIERVIDFQFLTLRANPWAKGHQKGRWPTIHLDLPSYEIAAQSRKRSIRNMLYQSFSLFGVDFWPLKVIQGQLWRCQSKACGSYD